MDTIGSDLGMGHPHVACDVANGKVFAYRNCLLRCRRRMPTRHETSLADRRRFMCGNGALGTGSPRKPQRRSQP